MASHAISKWTPSMQILPWIIYHDDQIPWGTNPFYYFSPGVCIALEWAISCHGISFYREPRSCFICIYRILQWGPGPFLSWRRISVTTSIWPSLSWDIIETVNISLWFLRNKFSMAPINPLDWRILHTKGSEGCLFNTLRPRQNACHFPDDNFKCIFLNKKCVDFD